MSTFPLYEQMSRDIKNKDLTKKQKKEFVTLVSKIDTHGAELMYVLIRIFEMNNSKMSGTYKLPYSGTYTSKNDITFDLESLPIKLKQLLFKFINIHIKAMEEERRKELPLVDAIKSLAI